MRPIAFDTETYLISRGNLAPKLVCAQFYDGLQTHLYSHRERYEISAWILEGAPIIGHNVAFDLAVLMAWDSNLVTVIFDKLDHGEIIDTMLAQQLLEIASGDYARLRGKPGYSLEAVAARYGFEKDAQDPWRMRYSELYDLTVEQYPEDARRYAEHDAIVTYQVYQEQLKQAHLLGDLAAQTRAALSLHLCSVWGVHTDPVAVERLRASLEQTLTAVRADLQAAGIVRSSGTRNIKAAQRLAWDEFVKIDHEPNWTPKGKERKEEVEKDRALNGAGPFDWRTDMGPEYMSLDEDSCAISGLDILRKYAIYTSANGLRTRVNDFAQGYEFPLQARFTSLIETGRTSCSKPKGGSTVGVQLQNMPRDPGYRECFIPRPGMAFVGSDISGAELHTFAQVCFDLFGFSELGKALNEGVDAHLRLASVILDIPYQDALARKKEPEIKGARQSAKIANFGLAGGMGAQKFIVYARTSYGKVFTIEEAKDLREKWFAATPEARPYFRYIGNLINEETGRGVIKQLRVDRWRGDVRFTDAANGLFQSLCADGTKAGLYAVTKACCAEPESPLYGCRPWNFVHDEIIIEAPIERVHESAMELQRLMEREFNRFVPDCPTTADPWASAVWSKKAEAVWKDGRLQIWKEKE